MSKYILQRLALLVPTLIGMSLLIFAMLRLLPGDIVDIIAGTDGTASSAAKEKLRESMGLSDPIPVQYVKWLGNLLQGDPGTSMRSGKPVGEILAMASGPGYDPNDYAAADPAARRNRAVVDRFEPGRAADVGEVGVQHGDAGGAANGVDVVVGAEVAVRDGVIGVSCV